MSLRIIVSGMIAAVPEQGGATWAVLQYLLGLRALGHEVYFIEEIPKTAVFPSLRSLSDSANADYFNDIMCEFEFEDRACLVSGSNSVGLDYAVFRGLARHADLLINLSGSLKIPDLVEHIPTRLYVDLDPGFTQLWQTVEGVDMQLSTHTHFATVGCLVGSSACDIPDCGVSWIPTWQPVVLDHWPASTRRLPDPEAGWTTIANWRGYGSIYYGNTLYGQKAHSLRELMDLPKRTSQRFRLALQIHPDERADIDALQANGWEIVNPIDVAGSPQDYQQFIDASRGEFGIAKSGYVRSRCGWFSDRSICYLATGRPVVAHDTGIRNRLPSGDGLFFFETADEILAALDSVDSDYDRHVHAARDIAEEYFDSTRVLPRLIDAVGGCP